MKREYWLIVLAVLLRLFLAITTIHPDLTSAFVLSSKYLLLDSHWFDFYRFIPSLPNNIVFNYPPLAYLLPSLIYAPFFSIIKTTAESLVFAPPSTSYYLPLLVYKLPMILADLGVAFLLPRLFSTPTHKQLSRLLWLFNPVSIYVSSVMGQVDTLICFFLVLGLINLNNKRLWLTAFFFGVSALIKPIGFFLIPLLAVDALRRRNLKEAFILPLIGFGTYLLGSAPYLNLPEFRYFAFFPSQNLQSTDAGIALASGLLIPWFYITHSLIVGLLLTKRLSLFTSLGLVVLSSLVFSHFHPQWFVWFTPWLLVLAIKSKQLWLYGLTLLAWLVVLFSFDASLHLGAFLTFRSFVWTIPQTLYFQQLNLLSRAWLIALIPLLALPSHEKTSKS